LALDRAGVHLDRRRALEPDHGRGRVGVLMVGDAGPRVPDAGAELLLGAALGPGDLPRDGGAVERSPEQEQRQAESHDGGFYPSVMDPARRFTDRVRLPSTPGSGTSPRIRAAPATEPGPGPSRTASSAPCGAGDPPGRA